MMMLLITDFKCVKLYHILKAPGNTKYIEVYTYLSLVCLVQTILAILEYRYGIKNTIYIHAKEAYPPNA